MPSTAEKIESLLMTGHNRRPIGSRTRLCIYVDKQLLRNAEQYKICALGSRSDNPPPLSRYIERKLSEDISEKELVNKF